MIKSPVLCRAFCCFAYRNSDAPYLSLLNRIGWTILEAVGSQGGEKTLFKQSYIMRLGSALILLATFCVVSLSSTNEARALMETPRYLEPIGDQDFKIFSRILTANGIVIGDANKVFFRATGFFEGEFFILRDENSNCIEDRCFTFLFSKVDNGVRLLAVALLPKRFAIADTVNRICSDCGNMFGFLFEDDAGRYYSIQASPLYAVIPDAGKQPRRSD